MKCIRCNKELGHANANNAKYIMNPNDRRTFGINKVEKIVKAPLTPSRVQAILEEKTTQQREYITDKDGKVIQIIEHPFTMEDFLKSTEIYPDELGRREVVKEIEEEVPKTAIICRSELCQENDDIVIWG